MSEKIMFVLLRTFGDVILGTTLVHGLKTKFPDSEIHFYTNRPYDELLVSNPEITEVHASSNWDMSTLFLEMVSGKYGRIYAPYQVRPECNMWHQNEATRHQHLVDFYWKRMGMHGCIPERECRLFPSEEDYRLADRHISMDQPRIAMHSTTNVPTKDWPFFGELVEELRKDGYCAVQVGAVGDKPINGAIDFRGKMGFLELAAFLSKCAAFVGLDSGPSYMADAMKVPSIIIQGSTNPVTSGPISGRPARLFAKETGYSDCQEVRCHVDCRHEVNCITKITVPMVMEELEPILATLEKPVGVGVG